VGCPIKKGFGYHPPFEAFFFSWKQVLACKLTEKIVAYFQIEIFFLKTVCVCVRKRERERERER
jgi:hypothetical protein